MKASDICVGDWLNIYTFPNDNPKEDDLFPAKVSAVSIFEPFKEPDDVIVELVIERTKGIASRPLNTCLPIELTEEILVKNGFCENIHYYPYPTYEYSDNEDFVVRIAFPQVCDKTEYNKTFCEIDAKWCDILHIDCEYVHQLQHLLQLCGIEKEIEL